MKSAKIFDSERGEGELYLTEMSQFLSWGGGLKTMK